MARTSLSREDFTRMSGSRTIRIHGDLFSLAASPLPKTRASKFACIVSKKVSPRAVDRNLIKRRCRACVAKRLGEIPLPSALAFSAKRASREATFAGIERDIDSIFKRFLKELPAKPATR